jgi:hypothetical protein
MDVLDVDESEWQRRRDAWTAPPLKATQGTLYKYIKAVTSASTGCVTDAWTHLNKLVHWQTIQSKLKGNASCQLASLLSLAEPELKYKLQDVASAEGRRWQARLKWQFDAWFVKERLRWQAL